MVLATTHAMSNATTRPPRCVAGALTPYRSPPNNTLRGVHWSPDGLCLLAASEDRKLRLFELPEKLQSEETIAAATDDAASSNELPNPLTILEGDAIYDYAWYPAMDSAQPATCCFASSSREHPARLWDAYTGQCRASYVSYNHLDEIVAPHSLAFSPGTSKLYCGFERAIRIFDIARPGRECELRPTCATKKSRDGQRGIVSCFAFAPDYSGLFAAGSFSGTTGLYVESQPGLIFQLEKHGGGITQLDFNHDGTLLYSAARRDGEIRCWDVRMSCRVLATYKRGGTPTNQRIGFELFGSASQGLITACQDGSVLCYDTTNPSAEAATLLTFGDATNAATMHPKGLPLLAVATGERRYALPRGGDASEEEEAEEVEAVQESSNGLSVWLMPRPPPSEGVVVGEAAAAEPEPEVAAAGGSAEEEGDQAAAETAGEPASAPPSKEEHSLPSLYAPVAAENGMPNLYVAVGAPAAV